jgi:chromobox protein 1
MRNTRQTDCPRHGAADVIAEYFDEIGGRPEPKGGQKRKGRASGVKSESGTPAASSAKRAKQEKAWSPPPGSWEHDVSHIDTVEESQDPKTGTLGRFAYLVWNNNKKTQHPLKHVYQKCPQKVGSSTSLDGRYADALQMLQYYESHLVFTQNDGGMNGDDEDGKNIKMKDVF